MYGHRLSTRLTEYDYRYGAFFISIVVKNRFPLFGEIILEAVDLSPEGQIIKEEWLRTPLIRPSVQLDEWIIMPDHFQAIAIINDGNENGTVGGASWRPCPSEYDANRIQSIQPVKRSLAKMINQFKATTTRRINDLRQRPGQSVWQRNYHDRIIRNEVELDRVRRYIRNNPRNA